MGIKILGVSLGTILMVLIVAVIVRKWGSQIPLINKVG